MDGLLLDVGDLVGHPGLHRDLTGELHVALSVGESRVDDVARVKARLESIPDGILVTATASSPTHHQCARCLLEWDDELEVDFTELFVRRPSEDQSLINPDATIDLGQVVHDELSLALPADPLCRPGCLGLCPTCGADLNTDPCAGHGDESASPFAALKELFQAES
jgi:uncharacterized protein